MRTFEEVEKLFETAQEVHSKRLLEAPGGMDYNEFVSYMNVTRLVLEKLFREKRLLKAPTFRPLSDFGDIIPLKEFVEACQARFFTDYDGSGNYVRGDMQSDIAIIPSDVEYNSVRKDFDTIVWFNK